MSGERFYLLWQLADVPAALALGRPEPRDNPVGVYLTAEQFATVRKMVDPAVARHVERQTRTCNDCGG